MTRSLVLVALVAAATTLALAAAHSASPLARSDLDDGRARGRVLPLFLQDGAPYAELAPARGPRGLFLLDTGASNSALDEGWLRSSGFRPPTVGSASVLGTTGALSVPRIELERLDLGTGFFLRPVFNVQSYRGFVGPLGRPQAGLIGADILDCYWLRFDYRARVVELALRSEKRTPSAPWSALPVHLEWGVPTVPVRLGALELPCRIDTGASYHDRDAFLDVNRATVEALARAGVVLRPRGKIGVVGVSGPESLELFTAPVPLAIGPVRVEDVVLVVHDRGTLAGPSPLALAGSPILARLGSFVVDPFERTFHVRPARRR